MPDYVKAADRAARKFGVDPGVFKAMIQQESGFTEGKTSPAGARDIAQFIPSTAKAYGVTLGDNRVTDDLEGAARYLKANLDRTGGNYHEALSIYNSGRPDGYKSIPETQNYVRTILANAGSPQASAASAPSRSRTVTTSKTTPGVDRSGERRALILNFLQQRHNPQAVVNLAQALPGAQDTPARTTYSTKRTSSAASVASGRTPTTKNGQIIGTPYQGTHTLGNWQSDNAVDIAVPIGTPMVALQDGTIVKVRHRPQDGGRFAGDQITIRGANGNEYFYAHGVASVKAGEKVRKGQQLGTTGSANGVAHLHFGQMKGSPYEHVNR